MNDMKPLQILLNIIDLLNTHDINEPIKINELKDNLPHHYNTIREYLSLIALIQEFCPKIVLDISHNELEIVQFSPLFKTLNIEDQTISYLFIKKSFEKQTAIEYFDLFKDDNSYLDLIKNSPYLNHTWVGEDESIMKLWLSKRGRIKAQGIFNHIYAIVSKSSELKFKTPNLGNPLISPFEENFNDIIGEIKCLSQHKNLYYNKNGEFGPIDDSDPVHPRFLTPKN